MSVGSGKKILVLGGYGAAGLPIAEMLLAETDARLILAGRNEESARDAAKGLNEVRSEERVEGMCVDAAKQSELVSAFRLCDLVVVCAPLTGIGPQVVGAALEASIDYVGLNVDVEGQSAIEASTQRIEQTGNCFITDAGAVPGVPSALARWADQRFDTVDEVTVGMLVRDRNLSYGSAIDMMAATGTPPVVCEQGVWRRASLTESRTVDFGSTFGTCSCFPMDLPEMVPLRDLLDLQRCGAYVATVNPVANVVAALWFLLGLGKTSRGSRLGASLLVRAMAFTRPPFGIVITVETIGEIEGRRQSLRVSLRHEDGYIATAIPTVAFLVQLLDGSARKPGVRTMGCAADPDRLVADMGRLGMAPVETVTAA